MNQTVLETGHTPSGQVLLDSLAFNGGCISRRSGLFHRCFEPANSVLLSALSQNSETLVDIGANIGYFSVFLAPHVSRVHAIEPTTSLIKLLEHNRNECGFEEKIKVHPIAVSDAKGSVSADKSPIRSSGPERVDAVSMDQFLSDHQIPPHQITIKMDVDGFESIAFRGMTETLKSAGNRFYLLFEFNPVQIPEYDPNPNAISEMRSQIDAFSGCLYRVTENRDSVSLLDQPLILNGERIGTAERLKNSSQMDLTKSHYYLLSTNELKNRIEVSLPFLKSKGALQEQIYRLRNSRKTSFLFSNEESSRPRFPEMLESHWREQWLQHLARSYTLQSEILDQIPKPQTSTLLLRRSLTHELVGQKMKARDLLLEAIRLSDDSPLILSKSAARLYRLGEKELARREVLKASQMVRDQVKDLGDRFPETVGSLAFLCEITELLIYLGETNTARGLINEVFTYSQEPSLVQRVGDLCLALRQTHLLVLHEKLFSKQIREAENQKSKKGHPLRVARQAQRRIAKMVRSLYNSPDDKAPKEFQAWLQHCDQNDLLNIHRKNPCVRKHFLPHSGGYI